MQYSVLTQAIKREVLNGAAFVGQHAKMLAEGLGLAVLCMGATAYAVATSNVDNAAAFSMLNPVAEAAKLVQAKPAAADFTLYHTNVVSQSDSNASLLRRLGVSDEEALAFINADKLAQRLASHAGRPVQVQTDTQGHLKRLVLRWPHTDKKRFTRLLIERNQAAQLVSREEVGYLKASSRLAYAEIQNGFFAAMDEAEVPDAVALQLIDIFSSQIDFHRQLKRGDGFKLIYETFSADDELVDTGRLLGAEFVNDRKPYQAIWFQPPGSSTGAYYTMNGVGLRKSYLAAPLKFSRLSSAFGIRSHPLLGGLRDHKGVDYAAPTGTPVQTIAEGTVVFAGVQSGYGNCVEVKHNGKGGRSTFYAHLSRIEVRQGQKISQGEILGAVGTTGWATGPHLHFELRVNGSYQDPTLLVQEAASVPISTMQARREFVQLARTMRQQFDGAQAVETASAE